MSSLWLDVRYALRMMLKSPGLTAVLVITLALGIGASTTIFSVVNSVVLRPLPYEQPARLARIYTEFNGKLSLKRFWISAPEFQDLSNACRSCASVGGWARGSASLAGGDRPVRVDAAYVTHQLLPLLSESASWSGDFALAEKAAARLRADSARFDHKLGEAWAFTVDQLVGRWRDKTPGVIERLIASAESIESVPYVFHAARLRRHVARLLALDGDRDGVVGTGIAYGADSGRPWPRSRQK